MNRRGFFGALAAGVAALFWREREKSAPERMYGYTVGAPRWYVMGADYGILSPDGEIVWNGPGGALWVPMETAP